ncbi:molybdopterin molybdotransferase MoeA [Namhaeicola litoreus]|uniref:Molybdopterin molybdenumtransferase n=1 Tax=Namhaeicola litoreus TaxID=1052145 RepID=A0ABW3Y2P6_9FLAO
MSISCNFSSENISVEQALEIVLSQTEDFGSEKVDLPNSLGKVVKENIFADRDFPPFNRVSMDGIAIQFSQYNQGNRTFEIEGIQAAGTEQLTLENPKNCLEVMTGAVLPENTDTVIPYELIRVENGEAIIENEEVKFHQNVHFQGLDKKEKDLLIPKNTKISPAEISVLATVGKAQVEVSKTPKVAIISTGDELVEIHQTPKPFQIRRSNVHALSAQLKNWGIEAQNFHVNDNKKLLKESLAKIIQQFDVCIFSGAVSKGKFDFLPEVLEELGVVKYFHRVNQRPGKPFWFGKKGNKTFFAFPGNPVSTFMCCVKYFQPWFFRSCEINLKSETAILKEDYSFKPKLTYFLQVATETINGKVFAQPLAGKGSGDLANLTECNAFLELPAERDHFNKGEIFPIHYYR